MVIINKEKILELARLLVEEGKYDRAIKEYEKLVAADPDDMRVKLRIAELHVKRKQISDAIRVYREVAENYTQQGFFLKSVTVYKNVLRLNPSLNDVNELLAELYEKMGLIKDAVRQYDLFASALENKGEFERVMELRKKIVDLMPDNNEARVKLAELYQREGLAEDSIDQYEQLAHQLEAKGDNESRLIELYEKILSHRSDREDMLRRLVRMYYAKGEFKKTLKWLDYAKTLTPIDTELLGMQAEIYGRFNQLETSRGKYLALSDLHKENGDIDKAVDALAHIAVLVAGEEERMQKRASEMGAGMEEKFEKAFQRIQKHEEAEESEKATPSAPSEPTPPQKEKAAPEVKEEPADLDRTVLVQLEPEQLEEATKIQAVPPMHTKEKVPEKIAPKEEALPVAPPVEEAAPVADPVKLKKEAKAAYDLALLYKKIGLKSEFTKELQRAERLYAELAQESAEAAVRLSEIQLALGGKSTTLSTEKPKSAAKKPAAKQAARKPAAKKSAPKKAAKEAKPSKKKISFV